MLMMSFDDALTRGYFSFVYFLQFYLLTFFDIFQWGEFEPPNPTSGYATECGSYSPISLLSVAGKVFAHLLLKRL